MPQPQRIVSLISSATEMLFGLGLGDRVVGVSHECDYPSQVHERPRVTRSHVNSAASSADIDRQVHALVEQQAALYEVDVEQLVALRPNLIVTQAQCDVCAVRYADVVNAVREQPALAGAQIVALNPLSLADVMQDIRRIGHAAGCDEAAVRYVAELEARVANVQRRTARLAPSARPRVACLEWIEPPMLAANWTPQLVDWAGGNGGDTLAGRHSTYAHWEDVVRFDPEVIVVMPCGFDLARALVEAQVLPSFPHWTELSAVRSGRVFAVDGNAYFNRSGPRLVDSLEILAHLVHPGLFAAPAGILPERTWQQL